MLFSKLRSQLGLVLFFLSRCPKHSTIVSLGVNLSRFQEPVNLGNMGGSPIDGPYFHARPISTLGKRQPSIRCVHCWLLLGIFLTACQECYGGVRNSSELKQVLELGKRKKACTNASSDTQTHKFSNSLSGMKIANICPLHLFQALLLWAPAYSVDVKQRDPGVFLAVFPQLVACHTKTGIAAHPEVRNAESLIITFSCMHYPWTVHSQYPGFQCHLYAKDILIHLPIWHLDNCLSNISVWPTATV